jgi:hypothetical protein
VNFGRLTRAQIRQQERQQRQEGNAMFRELVETPNIECCTHCLNDDCQPHGNSRSSLCHAKSGVKRRRHGQQERKKESGVAAFESSLPSKKTADTGNWLSYCDQIFTNFRLIATFYGADFASERFLNYQGHQKMANMFVNGGKKYHHDRDGTE